MVGHVDKMSALIWVRFFFFFDAAALCLVSSPFQFLGLMKWLDLAPSKWAKHGSGISESMNEID